MVAASAAQSPALADAPAGLVVLVSVCPALCDPRHRPASQEEFLEKPIGMLVSPPTPDMLGMIKTSAAPPSGKVSCAPVATHSVTPVDPDRSITTPNTASALMCGSTSRVLLAVELRRQPFQSASGLDRQLLTAVQGEFPTLAIS
jgi:hypothetical protein